MAQISRLQDEIDQLRGNYVVCGVVESSSHYLPYQKHSVVIGASDSDDEKKLLVRSKRQELERAIQDVADIDQYIADMPDARTKEITTRKVINGESWPEIAAAIGYKETPDSVRMAYNRSFK